MQWRVMTFSNLIWNFAAMVKLGLIGYALQSGLRQVEVAMSRAVKVPPLVGVLIFAVLCSVPTFSQNPTSPDEDPARREAFQLYHAGK
jgi:sorbitol-specific phosphotransferase system component IIBC